MSNIISETLKRRYSHNNMQLIKATVLSLLLALSSLPANADSARRSSREVLSLTEAPTRGLSLAVVSIKVIGKKRLPAPRIRVLGAKSIAENHALGAAVVKLPGRGSYLAVVSAVNSAALVPTATSPETVAPAFRYEIKASKDARLVVTSAPRNIIVGFRNEGPRFLPGSDVLPASFCELLANITGSGASSALGVASVLSSVEIRSSGGFLRRSNFGDSSDLKALLVDSFTAADLACGSASIASASQILSFVKNNINPSFEYRGCGAPVALPDGSFRESCQIQISQAPFQKLPTCGPDVTEFCQQGVGGGIALFKAFAFLPDNAQIVSTDVIDEATGEFPAANIFPNQTWELFQKRGDSGTDTLNLVVTVTDFNAFGTGQPVPPAQLRYTLIYR